MIESENKKKADFLINHEKFLGLSSLLGVMAFGGLSLLGYKESLTILPSVGIAFSTLGAGLLIQNPFINLAKKYFQALSKEGEEIIFHEGVRKNVDTKGFKDIVVFFSELILHYHETNQQKSSFDKKVYSEKMNVLYDNYPILMKEIYQTHFNENGLVAKALNSNFNVDLFLELSSQKLTHTDEKILTSFLLKYSDNDDYGVFQSQSIKDGELFKTLPQSVQAYILNKYEPFTSLALKNNIEGEKLKEQFIHLYETNPFANFKELSSNSPTQAKLSSHNIKEQKRTLEYQKEQHLLEQELNYQNKNDRKTNFRKAMSLVKAFTSQCEKYEHVHNLAQIKHLDFETQITLSEQLIDFIYKHQYQNTFHDELFYLKNDVMTFYTQVAEEFSLLGQLKELNKKESHLDDIIERFDILNQKILIIQHQLSQILEDKIESTQHAHTAHFKAKL
jgi:hypothetical protein